MIFFNFSIREFIVDVVAKVLKVERVRYVYVKEEKQGANYGLVVADDPKNEVKP